MDEYLLVCTFYTRFYFTIGINETNKEVEKLIYEINSSKVIFLNLWNKVFIMNILERLIFQDWLSNSEYEAEYSWGTSREKDSVDASELNNSMLMLRYSRWKSGHTGLTIGMGIDNSGFILSLGITLRYF